MTPFEIALGAFTKCINNWQLAHSAEFQNLDYSSDPESGEYFLPVTIATGKKFAKIWMTRGAQKSIYCFVNIETGDILKPASYKAPAKGARGSIFDRPSYECHDLSDTGWLYR